MARYRMIPLVVEAIRYDGSNWAGIAEWIGRWSCDQAEPVLYTPEGPVAVSEGDWIVGLPGGEFEKCKDSVFRKAYEPAGLRPTPEGL